MIMETGVINAWLKHEGQEVAKGDPIVDVESDKAVQEVEAPASGVLARIMVPPGQDVGIGALLAVISEAGDTAEAVEALIASEADRGATDPSLPSPSSPSLMPTAQQPLPPVTSPREGSGTRSRISPAAEHLAVQGGLEWRSLSGSGPGGRIQVRDVQSALARRIPSGLSPLRQAIARRTTKSIEAPQAALCREIDLTDFLARRVAGHAASAGGNVSLTAWMVMHVVAALRAVPILNSRLIPEGHVISKAIHFGVVVSTEGGMMVPVIRDAQDKSPQDIHVILADFTRRARERTIRAEELEGGTFTLSNAGPLGIDILQPLLNPPEAAILGVGRIRERPTVADGRIVARHTAWFCLSTDHRVVDAEPAGEFLRCLDDLVGGRDEIVSGATSR